MKYCNERTFYCELSKYMNNLNLTDTVRTSITQPTLCPKSDPNRSLYAVNLNPNIFLPKNAANSINIHLKANICNSKNNHNKKNAAETYALCQHFPQLPEQINRALKQMN